MSYRFSDVTYSEPHRAKLDLVGEEHMSYRFSDVTYSEPHRAKLDLVGEEPLKILGIK